MKRAVLVLLLLIANAFVGSNRNVAGPGTRVAPKRQGPRIETNNNVPADLSRRRDIAFGVNDHQPRFLIVQVAAAGPTQSDRRP